MALASRLLAATTALVVLAMALGGVMRERCLTPGEGCCPAAAVLAFVATDPCGDCMAPAGPEADPSDVAARFAKEAPSFVALPFAPFVLDREGRESPITVADPFRSDPVPLNLRIRVLRI